VNAVAKEVKNIIIKNIFNFFDSYMAELAF